MSSQCNFDARNVEWYQNKIMGGIAESACRSHFEALGYAVFRAWENGAELDVDAKDRLAGALRTREAEARTLETDLASAKATAETSTAPPPAT